MRVYIESYGCTFNKADAQIIAGILKENKIDLVDSIEESDVIILNTCYVKLPIIIWSTATRVPRMRLRAVSPRKTGTIAEAPPTAKPSTIRKK